jgi:hypothetical protein
MSKKTMTKRRRPQVVRAVHPASQRRAKYFKTNRQFGSKTDPDATLVRQGGLKSRLRYKSHRVVDDAHEIITAVETTDPVLRRKA